MKGQSSLEYLITYGWMLIAVAIASGVAFTNFQSSCQETFNGFYTETISVEQFGVDSSGSLKMSVKNQKYTDMTIQSINISSQEKNISQSLNENISAGQSVSLEVAGIGLSEGCNELDVTMTYDLPPLQSQKVHGQMKAPLEITS